MTSVPQCRLFFFFRPLVSFFITSIVLLLHTLHYYSSETKGYDCCCFVILRNLHTHACPLLWGDLLSVITVSCLFTRWMLPMDVSCYTWSDSQSVAYTICTISRISYQNSTYPAHSKGREWESETGFNHVILHVKANETVCSRTTHFCAVKLHCEKRFRLLDLFHWHF